MPRLEYPIGPDGPIIDVRIWIGPEHEEALASGGLPVFPACSAAGLLDTGAQMTAIQQVLAERMSLPIHDWVKLRSSVLGTGEREAPVYSLRMTFGSLGAHDPPKKSFAASTRAGQ